MGEASSLGDFEQLVLLAILRLGAEAFAPSIRVAIEAAAARRVTRGALYSTLDRLEAKRYLEWRPDPSPVTRGAVPRRRFTVTATGLKSLRRSVAAVATLSRGLEGKLGSA